MSKVRLKGADSRHFHRDRHALIEGAQQYRLPSSARQSSDAQASGINLRQGSQVVEAAPHRQVKQSDGIRAHEVHVRGEIVGVFRLGKLAKAHPPETERIYPTLGEIDAALLLVLGRIARWFVTDHI